ncbi:2,3-dihydro-2,3-dihydroxybenzoate dehydrogenase [Polyangium sp. y55x31]|uniref:2,3-dihydro-2,3-dihydroxybenzoate dehydrogenase n=1 Tax=Polyangium sp. y55x31 TaxID=3042688 RepID=UPI0024831730|nr:2,3-dihydro-2,3-dihydroxybenzoate dehydrogenase [Polyangium sp. y55x31]MDI1481027.1 2,3-dihydro-2,3-dihydroxybenzoate dehydrogenase [Polyangium sp. y55x31]
MEFKDKVALVTGAAQGIGEAVARALAARGASVAALDANRDRLDVVAAEIRASGGRAAPFRADVTSREAVDAAVDRIERELGPIDFLVNVAGVLRVGLLDELRDEDWEQSFAVNARGVFYLCRAVSRRMVPRRSGAIVTVGSNAGRTPRMHMSVYAASKAAAAMFTKCMGLELAKHGIRCNVVSPGSTDTPMQRSLWKDESGAQAVIDGAPGAYKVGIPLQRIANPADVADAVLFLLSDRARHITMHDLCVDGGATLGV